MDYRIKTTTYSDGVKTYLAQHRQRYLIFWVWEIIDENGKAFVGNFDDNKLRDIEEAKQRIEKHKLIYITKKSLKYEYFN